MDAQQSTNDKSADDIYVGSPIFLVGLPRSGSTLWRRLFEQNSAVAVTPEMHFLNPWDSDFRTLLRKIGNLSDDTNVDRLIDAVFSDPLPKEFTRGSYFWRYIQKLEANGLPDALRRRICLSGRRDIGEIFSALIEEAARCQGKSRIVVQFPVYPTYMEKLLDWCPDARIIFISRDPRSLAASKTNDPGGVGRWNKKYPRLRPIFAFAGIMFATVQYILSSRIHTRMVRHTNYQIFFYERLLSEPEETVQSVCHFCDLTYEPTMLEPAPGQASSVTGEKTGGFDKSRMDGWKKVLSPRQAGLVTWLTNSSMQRFGYTPDNIRD